MNNYIKITFCISIFSFLTTAIFATDVEKESAAPKLNNSIIMDIDNHINNAIIHKAFPGAQLIIGSDDGIIYSHNYGYTDYSKKKSVTNETIYDLASCTKIFATTLSIMHLVEQDSINLSNKISDLLPEYSKETYASLTLEDLLYHASGFRAIIPITKSLVMSKDEEIPLVSNRKSDENPYLFDTNYYVCKDIKYDSTYIYITPESAKEHSAIQITQNLYIDKSYEKVIDSLVTNAYSDTFRGKYRYSDLNFHFLKKVIEKVTHKPINQYAQSLYDYMQIENIGYKPLEWSELSNITPTEYDSLFRRDTLQGIVHDEFACVTGGIAGHAGLFSNAMALSEICSLFLNGGTAPNYVEVFSKETVSQFTKAKKFDTGTLRGLGFDKQNSAKTPYSSDSYGHTGYTGTYFWIDPVENVYVILLTNRVHPSRTNKQFTSIFRSELWGMAKEVTTLN